ncbi:flavin-containing monooxygenase [Mycobacteroides chelonae]|uniref:flavin-containing monooxygenase n=1 Tax=Mycobacteroides chelonae TaxID=1774 RepID=UPI001E31D9FE|nr:NAD(P)/FAD-dependent oxidoreductase [Mycobacteroides chelonae]
MNTEATSSSTKLAKDPGAPQFEVAVIGAGPGGIAAGVKLAKAGIENFVIIERADDVGGSWHENHYPGLGVDIPAIAYQFSFARKNDWTRFFPYGAEVKAYHVEVARRFGLYPHMRFNTDIEREQWDDTRHCWSLHTADGTVITARFLISAVGAFIRPKQNPGIAGVEDFEGKIQRPSSWDHDYDLTGRRVGVIGTGASSVQIVPAIAGQVESLTVFQRTPVWCVPKPDFAMPKAGMTVLGLPGVVATIHGVVLIVVDAALRIAVAVPPAVLRPIVTAFDRFLIAAYRQYLKLVINDPETAAKLAPNFGVITKRPTASNGYLQAYNRDNVALVTEPIETITANGITTRDGVAHEFDMIVLATGYEVFSEPETYREGTILGSGGFDLATFYAEHGLQAYQSVSVPGLPNRWTLVGPYSWTGSGWHAFVEMTADHAVRAISEARRRNATLMEVRPDIAAAYHEEIYTRGEILRFYMAELNGHVPTYYRNSDGDIPYFRPSGYFAASRGNRRFPLEDYRYEVSPQTSSASTTGHRHEHIVTVAK